MKILFISLGCDKNLVDSEVMLGLLTKHGYTLTDDETQADVIVINTCCFIHDAKEESINTIFEMARYKEEFGIPDYDIGILTDSKKLADLFEATTAICSQPKKVSNWLMGETMRILKEKEMEPEDITFSPENLAKLIGLVEAGTINGSVAKEIFEKIFDEDINPEQYVEEHGLKQVNDEGALRATIEEVIAANPQSVEDYRNGKEKAIGFLVGQTMKAMKGKANPGMVNQILKELL